MADDKDLERQYRKNLMVVASIVLIYSIAGGHMGKDLSMFGAKLNFSHPEYLEYAMVAVMCFFCWRHLIVSDGIRKEMSDAVYLDTNAPACFRENNRQKVEDRYRKEAKDRGHNINFLHQFTNDWMFVVDRVGFISASITMRYKYGINIISERCDLRITKAPYQFFIINLSYRTAWLKHAISKSHFGDAILPLMTTIAALLAYGAHKLA